jgi:DNA polymerase-1
MKVLSIDVETTIRGPSHDPSPFFTDNKLCCISTHDGIETRVWKIEYDTSPYLDNLSSVSKLVDSADIIVGFALKFDLHWLRRYGIILNSNHRVWDCQLADFILGGQSSPFPSLDEVGRKHSLGGKLDGGLSSYWDHGIDTTDIPWEELEPYAAQDAKLTYEIYERQGIHTGDLSPLISLSNMDLLVLADMEWNGLKINVELLKQKEREAGEKIKNITDELNRIVDVPFPSNYNSTDFLSCLLYGGKYHYKEKEEAGKYSTGQKAGEVKTRWIVKEHIFPRLVEPLKRSKLKKEGFYSTDTKTLKNIQVKGKAHDITKLLLQYSRLEKLLSTYYVVIQKNVSALRWPDNMQSNSILRGRYNQVVARTGRLSSSKPNLQNLPEELGEVIVSRFL